MIRTTLALFALVLLAACSSPTAPAGPTSVDPSSYAVAHDQAILPDSGDVNFSGYSVSSGSVNVAPPSVNFGQYNCHQC